MATRSYGVIKAAGVRVEESTPEPPIEQGPLGGAGLVGIFRRGPTDEVVRLTGGVEQFKRIFGGAMRASHCPLSADHFYRLGRGAGVLHVLRVTDGSGIAAGLPVYNRQANHSVLAQDPVSTDRTQIATISARNVGAHGGRRLRLAGSVTLGSAVTGLSTINLGIATDANRWVGAELTFPVDEPGYVGIVSANTAPGVFTVEGAFPTTLAGGANGAWALKLDNTHEITGDPEALGVMFTDGGEDLDGDFGIQVYRDRQFVKAWPDVGLDAEGDAYWADAVNDDLDNWELLPVDAFVGDPADALERPANFAEIVMPGGLTTNTVQVVAARWIRAVPGSSNGNAFIDVRRDLSWGADAVPLVIVLTFTGTTTFSVVATTVDGAFTISGLPTGTLGSLWSCGLPWFPTFTARAGANAMAASDTITIYARPLPPNLQDKGAYLYAAASSDEGDARARWKVISNTADTITLQTGVDVTGDISEAAAPEIVATTPGPFSLSGGETFIYTAPGRGAATLTNSLTGSQSTTALAAELNSLEETRAGSAANKVVEFAEGTGSNAGKVVITCRLDFGSEATLTIGNGTLNSIIGLTNGQNTTGTDGQIVRVQWAQEMGGGYDGIAGIVAGDYTAVWDVATSPLNDLEAVNTGLIKWAMPGVTDSGAQVAAKEWCEAKGGIFYEEIDSAVLTEAAAVAHHQANLRSGSSDDVAVCHWPSYGYIENPYGSGLYLTPMTGAILGIEARQAVRLSGYQNAPAGEDYSIHAVFKQLPTDRAANRPRPLDNEILNSYGLIEMRHRGLKIYAFGDRIAGQRGRLWLHKRAMLSHIVRTGQIGLERLTWSAINPANLIKARILTAGMFQPWVDAGWFDGQITIKADETNNTPATRDAGQLVIEVGFVFVNTAEQVVLRLGERSLSVIE